tara:strand:+ start:153 stop:371 length:219 start_codon:yes stop_codon:yes gene_type:complete
MGFFNWISNFLGKSSTAEKTADMLEEVEIRTRDKKGRFIADDPNTPENEAFKKVKKRKNKVTSISKKKTKKK